MREPECWAEARAAVVHKLEFYYENTLTLQYFNGSITGPEFKRKTDDAKSSIKDILNNPNWLAKRPPRRMPMAKSVAIYWQQLGTPFPVDVTDPACFACGFQVKAWNYCDRAHLEDRFLGGLDHEANLVMLCPPCHRIMPMFEPGTYYEAIDWVLSDPFSGLINRIIDTNQPGTGVQVQVTQRGSNA